MVVAVNNPALSSLQKILVFNIEVDGVPINLTDSEIKSVEIGNSQGSHEYASITTQLSKSQISSFVNKTITFSYGKLSQRNKFFGYVVTVAPNTEYQQDTVVDIYCMGPTWLMQNGKPKYFENKTVPNVVVDLVDKYNLGVQVDNHPYSWPVIAQTDESDWEFLQTLATRLGYCIFNYRGVVRLADPVRILTSTGVYNRYIKGDDVIDPTRELLDWSATSQSLQLRDTMKPAYGYFETNSQGVRSVAMSRTLTPPYKLNTDTPVKDWGMAKAYNDAWDKRIDFWDQQANARVNGNALIVPGINISVQVSGVRGVTNEYDGIWMVTDVVHSLSHNTFQTQLTLTRDSRRSPTNTDFRWFWAINNQGAPLVLRREVGEGTRTIDTDTFEYVTNDYTMDNALVTLHSSLWESSWRKPEYVTDILTETEISNQ